MNTHLDDLLGRILAAAEVLAVQHGVAVPEALRVVSGSPQERQRARLEGIAVLLESLVLEQAQAGLSAKLDGYTALPVLRDTSDDDLLEIGMTRTGVRALRKLLDKRVTAKPGTPAPPADVDAGIPDASIPEDEFGSDPAPDLDIIAEELRLDGG